MNRIDIDNYIDDRIFDGIKECREYLIKDIGTNISLLEAIRLGFGKVVYCDEDSLMIYNTGTDAFMISTSDTEKCRMLMRSVDSDYITVNNYAMAKVAEEFGYVVDDNCIQVVYLYDKANDLGREYDIRVLSFEDYYPLLKETYHGLPDEAIVEHLKSGEVIGLFIDDEIVGYIGEHSEGSIGMLYVLPEHRKHGYAMVLENAMIDKKLKEGKIPFAQILEENGASLALQKKLGYDFSKEFVLWMHN